MAITDSTSTAASWSVTSSTAALFCDEYWFDIRQFIPKVSPEPELVDDVQFKSHLNAARHRTEHKLRASKRCGRMML